MVSPVATGVRLSNSNLEGYIYLPMVPENWKCTAIYIGAIDASNDNSLGEDIAVISRSYVHQGGSSASDYMTRHLALTSFNSGTNAEKAFTTAFVPNGSNYMICFLNINTGSNVITGGYLKIIRQ